MQNIALHVYTMHWLMLGIPIAVMVMGVTVALAAEQVTLTVFPGARQMFAGLGVSENNAELSYVNLSPTQRQTLSHALWHDLNLKVFRLWLGDDPSADAMYQNIVKRYVDSHLVEDALKNGVTELLLAPEGSKLYTREYAARYADVIKRLRDEKGVRITTTGICNEPNNFDPKITPRQATAAVKFFREELDKRGLDDVKIVATEHSFCDQEALAHIQGIKDDPAAWDVLAGISTHSYSMAANREIVSLVVGSGKSYWITEAGDNGPEDLHDTKRALTMSGRFLSDMNHLVTHWVWFRERKTSIRRITRPALSSTIRRAVNTSNGLNACGNITSSSSCPAPSM
jgi:O-glycosyl hydrolase